jgi:hypothetical protein
MEGLLVLLALLVVVVQTILEEAVVEHRKPGLLGVVIRLVVLEEMVHLTFIEQVLI